MSNEIRRNKTDLAVVVLKSVLGTVPVAGSLLTELIGTVIPKQRIDRIADFTERLENKIADLDRDMLIAKLRNENYSALIEEAARQALQAITNERREYIATLLASSLHEDTIDFSEQRFLLRLLEQINDVQIIFLRFWLWPFIDGDEEFRNTHKNILCEGMFGNSDDPNVTKTIIRSKYLEELVRLELLHDVKERQKIRSDGMVTTQTWEETYIFDPKKGYLITPMGKLLLSRIGLRRDVNWENIVHGSCDT